MAEPVRAIRENDEARACKAVTSPAPMRWLRRARGARQPRVEGSQEPRLVLILKQMLWSNIYWTSALERWALNLINRRGHLFPID